MRTMKILHINTDYIGTTVHSAMIRSLNRYTENVVFCPTRKKIELRNEKDSNVFVCNCFKWLDRFNFKNKQKKILAQAQGLFKDEKVDCIHAYTLFTDGNCAMELSKKKNVPFVVAVRNTDVNVFFKYRFFLRRRGIEILKKARMVFFLSETYKSQVLNKYVPKYLVDEIAAKSRIIPNGVDEFWHENLYIDRKDNAFQNKRIKIVYAGEINRNKNILTTQRAVDLLEKRGWNVEYTVVGKITDRKVFNRIVKNSHTKYCIPCAKEELINVFRENDIFVMPSFYETFGLVYAEAMSQGLPVIYTKGQGFDGWFQEGEVGYSVIANNEKDIATKIELITQNYDIISNKCRELVSNFDWHVLAREYFSLYQKVCKNITADK